MTTFVTASLETKSFFAGHLTIGPSKYLAEGQLEISTLSGDEIPETSAVTSIIIHDIYRAPEGGTVYELARDVSDGLMQMLVQQVFDRYTEGTLFPAEV